MRLSGRSAISRDARRAPAAGERDAMTAPAAARLKSDDAVVAIDGRQPAPPPAARSRRAGRAAGVDVDQLIAGEVAGLEQLAVQTGDARFHAAAAALSAAPPRWQAKRERDACLVELARRHLADVAGVRAKARAVASLVRRYAATGWLKERHDVTCPPDRIGKPEALIWSALRAFPKLPADKHLRKILSE